jgi:hypothetical protein
MADSRGSRSGIPRLKRSRRKKKKRDSLRSIARHLRPLVRDHLDWWREAVRRWASNPPLHYVGQPLIKTKKLVEDLRQQSREQVRRGENEGDAAWKRRRAAAKGRREEAEQRLAKIEGLKVGSEIRDDQDYIILPVPFTDETTTPDERIALLAAIHDAYATADVRIDPFVDLVVGSKADADMLTAWWVLWRDRVPNLHDHWDTHEAAIEMFVAEVVEATKGNRPSGTDAKPKRRGRKKADDATLEREAAMAAKWVRARDANIYKGAFARENKLTVKTLNRLLGRVAWRQRASE